MHDAAACYFIVINLSLLASGHGMHLRMLCLSQVWSHLPRHGSASLQVQGGGGVRHRRIQHVVRLQSTEVYITHANLIKTHCVKALSLDVFDILSESR